jgi:hypothetical protein
LAHIDTVGFGELAKRRASRFLVKNALACIANITATIGGGQVCFLLTPADCGENLGDLCRGRLFRL